MGYWVGYGTLLLDRCIIVLTTRRKEYDMTGTFDAKWMANTKALRDWAKLNGGPMAPAGAVVTSHGKDYNVGSFVAYARSRQRRGLLSQSRRKDLESIKGWTWEKLQPGPKGETERNEQIRKLRRQGVTLAELADQFGMSRQRIHQIAPDMPNTNKHTAHLKRRREERYAQREAEAEASARRERSRRSN